MWQYIINIVFYPFTWLWNNVMNVSIYGVKPVQIFALIAFGMALYRFIIIPFSTQFSVSAELPAMIGRLSRQVSGDIENQKIQEEREKYYESKYSKRGY